MKTSNRTRWSWFLAVLAAASCAFFLGAIIKSNPAADASETGAAIRNVYGKLPLSFERNAGQTDSRVQYLSRGKGYTMFLTGAEAVLSLHPKMREPQNGEATPNSTSTVADPSAVVRMRLVGGNPAPSGEGVQELPGKVNYFHGADPSQWRTNVPTYEKVAFKDVYPGVDLVYYGNQRNLEFDFNVAPGVDPKQIRFVLSDETDRPRSITLDSEGDLVVGLQDSSLKIHRPVIYQDNGGSGQQIAGEFQLLASNSQDPEVGFAIGDYDRSKPLIIDPVLSYSTYLGGSESDFAADIAISTSGVVYLTGDTRSTNFPLANAIDSTAAGFTEAFVTKLNATGATLLYSTYLGGTASDAGRGIATDAAGNAYLTGFTSSTNFPTVNPIQGLAGGPFGDAFAAKLSPNGDTLLYSTYLGGTESEIGSRITIDASGNSYIAGCTDSTNFPVVNPIQANSAGPASSNNVCTDGFIAKLNTTGTALVFSTYLGGTGDDTMNGIVVDSSENVVVAGETTSTNFPVTSNVIGPTYRGGQADGFLTSLNAAGSALRYSTYFGGAASDSISSMALDTTGNVVVVGSTFSTNFPVTGNAVQSQLNGLTVDAFVSRIDNVNSFTKVLYSTYLGGSAGGNGGDNARDVAVDSAGNAYVVGTTDSTNFPLRLPIQGAFNGGAFDSFIAKLSTFGGPLLYSTYIGGADFEEAMGVAVDTAGTAYVTGYTRSSNFPTVNPIQSFFAGGVADGYALKVSPSADVRITMTDSPDPVAVGSLLTYTMTVTNLGPDAATNVRVTDTLAAGATFSSVTASQGSCSGTTTVTCTLGILDVGANATITLRVTPTTPGSRSNTASVTRFEPDPVGGNNSATVTTTVGYRLTVTIVRQFNGNGTVTSLPAGIDCLTDCTEIYSSGATVRLFAHPVFGSQLNGWSGACTGTGACIFSMNANKSVTATFGPLQ